MTIETPEGVKTDIEEKLNKYGLVVTGKLKPEEFTNNPQQAIELKSQLDIVKLQVKNYQLMLDYTNNDVGNKNIEIELKSQLKIAEFKVETQKSTINGLNTEVEKKNHQIDKFLEILANGVTVNVNQQNIESKNANIANDGSIVIDGKMTGNIKQVGTGNV